MLSRLDKAIVEQKEQLGYSFRTIAENINSTPGLGIELTASEVEKKWKTLSRQLHKWNEDDTIAMRAAMQAYEQEKWDTIQRKVNYPCQNQSIFKTKLSQDDHIRPKLLGCFECGKAVEAAISLGGGEYGFSQDAY